MKGKDSHTGTTALTSRSDALLAASRMIVAAREVAHAKGGLATMGIIVAAPGSTNTIAGHVRFSLDVRAKSDALRDEICDELMVQFGKIADADPDFASQTTSRPEAFPDQLVEWEVRVDSTSTAVRFDKDCIECVRAGAEDVFGADTEKLTRRITSGAGHDSVYTSKRCPTTMLFVPSLDGVSHNPREYTSPEDCEIGAQVLMNAVLRYDRSRACIMRS